MNEKTKKSVAESLEAEAFLIPYMPFLLQDFWDLGSAIEEILDGVGQLPFSDKKLFSLDLGCGKGAVSIRLASQYGFRATGIDAMPEFLRDAEKRALEHNVADKCQFIESDIHEYLQTPKDFDLVILASLGGILGSNSMTIEKMRTQVHSGGFILVDDGYLKNKKSLDRRGYTHYKDYHTTVEELVCHRDQLIKEISTTHVSREINERFLKRIRRRADELSLDHPELKTALDAYIMLQTDECEILEHEIEGMIWILQKND